SSCGRPGRTARTATRALRTLSARTARRCCWSRKTAPPNGIWSSPFGAAAAARAARTCRLRGAVVAVGCRREVGGRAVVPPGEGGGGGGGGGPGGGGGGRGGGGWVEPGAG